MWRPRGLWLYDMLSARHTVSWEQGHDLRPLRSGRFSETPLLKTPPLWAGSPAEGPPLCHPFSKTHLWPELHLWSGSPGVKSKSLLISVCDSILPAKQGLLSRGAQPVSTFSEMK